MAHRGSAVSELGGGSGSDEGLPSSRGASSPAGIPLLESSPPDSSPPGGSEHGSKANSSTGSLHQSGHDRTTLYTAHHDFSAPPSLRQTPEGQALGQSPEGQALRQSSDGQAVRQSLGGQAHGLRWFYRKNKKWRRRLIQRPWLFPIAAMHLAATTIQRAWRPCWLRQARVSSASGRQSKITVHRANAALERIAQAEAAKEETSRRASAEIANASEESPQLTEEEIKEKRQLMTREALQRRYLNLLKRQYDSSVDSPDTAVSSRSLYPSFEHFCAATIKSAWLHHKGGFRKAIARIIRYRKQTLYHIAAAEIQHYWMESRDRVRMRRIKQEQDQRTGSTSNSLRLDVAATRIQQMWRRVNDYRIFVALREIIASFRGTGEPYQLLRSILPRECMLLDPSMQVHLRFRLGGAKFPPSIYYKIFTHGNVVDLGSFAPRNYAGERMGLSQGDEDWYARVENNGWRPLVMRQLSRRKEDNKDEVEKTTARKVIKNFHYSRLRRRQDIEWERKQRTRAWMRKLYSLDMGEAAEAALERRTTPEEKVQTVAGAAAAPSGAARAGAETARGNRGIHQRRPQPSGRMPRRPTGPAPPTGRPRPPSRTSMSSSTAGAIGAMGDFDDEVEEVLGTKSGNAREGTSSGMGQDDDELSDDQLLEWSKQLDFDAYLQSWQMIATSDASEGSLPIGVQQMATAPMRSPPHTMIGLVH